MPGWTGPEYPPVSPRTLGGSPPPNSYHGQIHQNARALSNPHKQRGGRPSSGFIGVHEPTPSDDWLQSSHAALCSSQGNPVSSSGHREQWRHSRLKWPPRGPRQASPSCSCPAFTEVPCTSMNLESCLLGRQSSSRRRPRFFGLVCSPLFHQGPECPTLAALPADKGRESPFLRNADGRRPAAK